MSFSDFFRTFSLALPMLSAVLCYVVLGGQAFGYKISQSRVHE